MMEYNKKNRKNKKIMVVSTLFLLIILVATYVAYSYYKNNREGEILKNEVLAGIVNHDLAFFLENELYERIWQRMENDNFEVSSNLNLATNMKNNMFSELDLSKFELKHKWIKDNKNIKSYHELLTKYAGNDLLKTDFLMTQNQFALKSDEIVNRYVGLQKQNVQNTVNQIKQAEVDLSDFKKVKNFVVEREPISFSALSKVQALSEYAKLVQKQVLPEKISKKENVLLTMDSEQISVAEYTIVFDFDQMKALQERNDANARIK